MIEIFIFCVIFLFLIYLYSKRGVEKALVCASLFHFLFFAIRTRYGNDYNNYVDIYDMFSNMSVRDAISDTYRHFEIGWRFICVLCGNFGFQSIIIFVQAITSLSLFLFIKYCIPRNLALFAAFIYVMNPDYMLIQLSMLRESVAINLCLISIILILTKKKLLSIPFAIVALLFHRTSMVFFLVYIFLFFEPRLRKKYNVVIGIILISLLPLARTVVGDYVSTLFDYDSFSRYESYLGRTDGLTFGLGNIIEFCIWGLPAFVYYKYCNEYKERTACQIYLLTYVLFPFATLTVLLQRLSIYFSIVSIFVIPLLCTKMDLKIRYIFITLFVIYELVRFVSFFYSPIYGKFFIEYHTIFF